MEAWPGEARNGRLEMIARHWESAGSADEGCRAWHRAGRAAADTSAFVEALAHYEAAVRLLRTLPPSPERDRREVPILFEAGQMAFRVRGGGSALTRDLFTRAHELTDAMNLSADAGAEERFNMLSGQFAVCVTRPNYRRAAQLAIELRELAGTMGSSAILTAESWIGATALLLGDIELAEEHLWICLDAHDPGRGRGMTLSTGLSSAALLAQAAVARGDSPVAADLLERAFELLTYTDEPFNRAWLTLIAAKVASRGNDRAELARLAVECHELALEHGFEQIEPQARCLAAWSRATPPGDSDIEVMRSAISDIDASGSRAESSLHRLLLVRALLDSGRIEDARGAYDAAVAYCEETEEWLYRREVNELGGRLGVSS
jgi:tetratricopeptide (TPR) repeat protein